MQRRTNIALLLLSIGLVLVVVSPFLFSDGMFMDGLLYACVSRNLALGIGDPWHLHLTSMLYPQFNEHPPLAFVLQAGFFRILGDQPFVEALYSFLTVALTAGLLFLCWREIAPGEDKNRLWLPFSVWMMIPIVTWSISNNLLENTMMIFTTLSIWLFLRHLRRTSPFLLLIAGFSLFLAFLSKGFVALFPLSLPFWSFWLIKTYRLSRFLKETALLLFSLLFPFLLMFWLMPDSLDSLQRYFHKQVLGSLSSVQTVSTRFYILGRLIAELTPIVILLVISKIIFKADTNFKSRHEILGLLLAVGLSGILPMMISLKQSGFYMLAALPPIALAMSLLLLDSSKKMIDWLEGFSSFRKILWASAVVVLCAGILLQFIFIDKIGRDKDKIQDIHVITSIVPAGSTISVPGELYNDWSLQGYLERKAFISLDARANYTYDFYLSNKEDKPADAKYEALPVDLKGYRLYRKIE